VTTDLHFRKMVLVIMPLQPDNVGEGIMLLGCVFVQSICSSIRSFVCSSVCTVRYCYHESTSSSLLLLIFLQFLQPSYLCIQMLVHSSNEVGFPVKARTLSRSMILKYVAARMLGK